MKILCFGDSNTFGFNPYNFSRYSENERWTGILKKLCGKNLEIVEAGCNNRTALSDNPAGKIYTGYKILPEYLNNIDYVILQLGINDLQTQYNVQLEEFKKGITDIVKSTGKVPVLLICPVVLNKNILNSKMFSKLFDKNSIEKSKILPSIYKEIAIKTNCKLLDLNKITKISDIDGLHHTPEQHQIIAQEIHKILTQNFTF